MPLVIWEVRQAGAGLIGIMGAAAERKKQSPQPAEPCTPAAASSQQQADEGPPAGKRGRGRGTTAKQRGKMTKGAGRGKRSKPADGNEADGVASPKVPKGKGGLRKSTRGRAIVEESSSDEEA